MKGHIEKREDENGNEVWWLVGEHGAMRLWQWMDVDTGEGLYALWDVGHVGGKYEYQRLPEPHLILVED